MTKDKAKDLLDQKIQAATPVFIPEEEAKTPMEASIQSIKTEAEMIDQHFRDRRERKRGYFIARDKKGFWRLDKLLNGLNPGVFVIAAPPSAGKTTFIKQMADHVAEFNEDVPILFFSYEQSGQELRDKSMARMSRQDNQLIREGKEDKTKYSTAGIEYQKIGKNMKIIESDYSHDIEVIRYAAEWEMNEKNDKRAGKPPVIFIDYLQLVQVKNQDFRDKRQDVDYLLGELRRMARTLGTPIVALSSMPRAAYEEVSMGGFKESGGIEYATDVAAIMNIIDENDEGAWRTIDLVILKHRNGQRRKIQFQYEPSFDTFKEESDEALKYIDTFKNKAKKRR